MFVEDLVGRPMGPSELPKGPKPLLRGLFPGRPPAQNKTLININQWFVKRDPESDSLSVPLSNPCDKRLKFFCRSRLEPASLFGKPGGGGEMMQRHHRFEALGFQGGEDFVIMTKRLLVPFPFPGFKAAPFKRESVGGMPQGTGKAKIFPEMAVVIAGCAGSLGHFPGLLPSPPIVPLVPAFDLLG